MLRRYLNIYLILEGKNWVKDLNQDLLFYRFYLKLWDLLRLFIKEFVQRREKGVNEWVIL